VTYRDDSEALLARADALEVDLRDAEAKLADASAGRAALEAEAQRLRDEVAALQARVPPEEVEPRFPIGSALKPLEEMPLTAGEPLIRVGEQPPPDPSWGLGYVVVGFVVVAVLLGIILANQG
jgi:hypothetical protein